MISSMAIVRPNVIPGTGEFRVWRGSPLEITGYRDDTVL
jgi:hypothetical protein